MGRIGGATPQQQRDRMADIVRRMNAQSDAEDAQRRTLGSFLGRVMRRTADQNRAHLEGISEAGRRLGTSPEETIRAGGQILGRSLATGLVGYTNPITAWERERQATFGDQGASGVIGNAILDTEQLPGRAMNEVDRIVGMDEGTTEAALGYTGAIGPHVSTIADAVPNIRSLIPRRAPRPFVEPEAAAIAREAGATKPGRVALEARPAQVRVGDAVVQERGYTPKADLKARSSAEMGTRARAPEARLIRPQEGIVRPNQGIIRPNEPTIIDPSAEGPVVQGVETPRGLVTARGEPIRSRTEPTIGLARETGPPPPETATVPQRSQVFSSEVMGANEPRMRVPPDPMEIRAGVQPEIRARVGEPNTLTETAPRGGSAGAIEPPTSRNAPPPPETPSGGGGFGLPEHSTSAIRGGRFDRYVESFRKEFGPEGEALSDGLGKVIAKGRAYFGRTVTGLDEAFGRIPLSKRSEAASKLGDWIERVEPTPPWAQELVNAAREATRQNALNMREAGLYIQDQYTGPRMMNPDWDEAFTHSIQPEIAQKLREQSREGYRGPTPELDRWMAEGKNASKPNPFASKAVPEEGPLSGKVQHAEGMYAGAERARVYEVPREFMPKDQYQTLRQHLRRSSLSAAENEVFRQTFTDPETGAVTKSGGDLQRIYDSLAQREGRSRADQAKFRVDRILERNAADKLSETAKSFNRVASAYTIGTKLAGSIIQPVQQLSQLVNQFTQGGAKPVLGGFRDAAMKGFRKALNEARREGSIAPDAYRQSLDLMDERGGSPAMRMTRAGLDVTQKPQSSLDTLSRVVASEGAKYHLESIQKSLRKGGRAAEWAEREMLRLDLPEDYRAEIRSGAPSADAVRMVRQRWTGYTNIESGITEFPRLAGHGITSPRWMWARTLKNFTVAQGRTWAETVLSEASKGNFAPALRWAVATTLVGEAVIKTRENTPGLGSGPSRDRVTMDEVIKGLEQEDIGPLARRLGQDINYGGTMGMAGMIPSLALDTDNAQSYDRQIRMLLPPILADAYTLGRGAVSTATTRTAPEVMRDAAKRGQIRMPGPGTPRTRGEIAEKQLGIVLRQILPQFSRNYDAIMARISEDYRQEQIRKTMTQGSDGVPRPRSGQERRRQHLIDLGTR